MMTHCARICEHSFQRSQNFGVRMGGARHQNIHFFLMTMFEVVGLGFGGTMSFMKLT